MKGVQDVQQPGQNEPVQHMKYESDPDGQSIQEDLRKGLGW